MKFLGILKNDFKVFLRCINYQRFHAAKMKDMDSPFTSVVRRTYCEEARGLPKVTSDNIIVKLKQFDKVGSEYNLIYRAPRTLYFSLLHGTLLITGFSFPILGYLVGLKHNFQFPMKLSEGIVLADANQFYVGLGAVTFFITLTFLLVSRFPFRVYYRKTTNDYIAVYSNTLIPWMIRHVTFKKGEVTRIKESDIMVFQLSNYKIKGHKCILLEEHFFRPADLEFMLDPKSLDDSN